LGYPARDDWTGFLFNDEKRGRDFIQSQLQTALADDLATQLKTFKYELMTAIEALSFWDTQAEQKENVIHKILRSNLDAFQPAHTPSSPLTDYERVIDRVANHFIPGLNMATGACCLQRSY